MSCFWDTSTVQVASGNCFSNQALNPRTPFNDVDDVDVDEEGIVDADEEVIVDVDVKVNGEEVDGHVTNVRRRGY